MTWDSFRQRVRYLRGEALSSWPPSITNVILQPMPPRHPDDPIAGVHVWCIGSVPAHGMRRGSLLHCSVPAAAADNSCSAAGSSGTVFRVPVAALRSVWMDPDCHAMMDCESLALLRYLQTAAIERLLWHKDAGMVILADKGRRWIEGHIECSRPATTTTAKLPQASGEAHVLFTECSLADSPPEPPDAAEQLRENDWYYERGGKGGRFVAFSRSSNVVVYDTATKRETQVTWAEAAGVQYGAVDISMEEELGRTAGVFWQQQAEPAGSPNSAAGVVAVDRMLCARVDERHVMSVGLPGLPPSLASNKADSSASTIGEPASLFADSRYGWDSGCAHRQASGECGKSAAGYLTDFQKYSRPGTPGALTEWVIIEIEHTSSEGIVRQRVRPLHERFRLSALFPWCEYVVRAGWMPANAASGGSGAAVWLQLLDRPQKRTAIVRVPLGCFAPGVAEPYDPLDEAACSTCHTQPPPPAPNAHIDVLYEEEQPDAWINLNHALRFLTSSSASSASASSASASAIRFIIASERAGGFNHLHLVTAHIAQPPRASAYVRQARQEIVPLTRGSWPVTDDAPVFVDEARSLVYFSARRPNPLTTNLFATSYRRSSAGSGDVDAPLWQLTCSGYTHSHFAFDASGGFFYCQASNLTTPVRHCIYMIQRPQPGLRRSLVRNDPLPVRRNSSRLPLDGLLEDMPFDGSLEDMPLDGSLEDVPFAAMLPPDDCISETMPLAAMLPPDDCISETMSFYSASCEPPTHGPVSAQCLCVMEISGAPLLRLDPLISPDPGVRRMSSIRNPPAACRLSVCSSSSSLISLSSQSQSVDSIAPDEMFVERLLSKLRTSGQSIQHSTLASDLMKLRRLTPAYVSQRVTKAVRSALPFCSTPTILPRHLLHSSLLQPLARTSTAAPAAAAAAAVGKEPLAAARPSSPRLIHKKQLLGEEASPAPKAQDAPTAHRFVSSLTSSTRTFIARESLLGIDKAMQPGGGAASSDPVPRLFCVPVPRSRRGNGSEPYYAPVFPRNRHGNGPEPDYELVFGHVYLPPDFKPGHHYPTVVNAYGGPQCQLVTNAFPYPRHRRLAMLTRMAPAVAKAGTVPEFVPRGEDEPALNSRLFGDNARSIAGMHATVVVCLDGRGTPHRGLGFEAAIRGRLGRLEVDDIVCALEYLCTYGLSCIEPVQGTPPGWCQHAISAAMAENEDCCWESLLRPPVFAPSAHAAGNWDASPPASAARLFIDKARIAIHGWSYGGYVALRALALYPNWFRLAIAGAPVVRWDWYSSAYIERYLGVLGPQTKQIYEDASIAAVADRLLPSAREHGRILVVHGWNDDNVHVAHTAALVRELSDGSDAAVQLCVYANERHGLRLPSSNEHFETMLSFWLFHFLQSSS
ncbi:dipeptidylpeptidase [Coemansia erecta]|nr:dipeptidylpeptidase [Coemansia erecta]